MTKDVVMDGGAVSGPVGGRPSQAPVREGVSGSDEKKGVSPRVAILQNTPKGWNAAYGEGAMFVPELVECPEILEILSDLLERQEPLGEEFERAIFEDIEELYEDSASEDMADDVRGQKGGIKVHNSLIQVAPDARQPITQFMNILREQCERQADV